MNHQNSSANRSEQGRPRDPNVERNVLAATRQLLLEMGYERLSIEAVAKRAGVGKTSIYRRWNGKTQLVLESVFQTDGKLPVREDFSTQLAALIKVAVADFRRQETQVALPGLVHECVENPEGVFPVFDAELQLITQALRKAQTEGVAREDVDGKLIFDLYVGAVFMRTLRGGNLSPSFAKRLSQVILQAVEVSDKG